MELSHHYKMQIEESDRATFLIRSILILYQQLEQYLLLREQLARAIFI